MSALIKTVKESGFCFGVQSAINKANEQALTGKKIYLYGDLVNNEHVMNGYKQKGLVVVESLGEIEANSTVIIRAHGVPKNVFEELCNKNVEVIDCTCPKVKNIHNIVNEKSNDGYKIIIIGKKGHPEVIGTYGWCKNGYVKIISTLDELKQINYEDKLCVVAQTTCSKIFWNEAVEEIKKQNPLAEIYNTLCDVVSKRLERAAEMAKESDVMVVVGDVKSANSIELYKTCLEHCNNVLFVSSLEDLIDNKDFPDTGAKIGLAGSSSAPADILDEIHGFLLFSNFLAEAKNEIEDESNKYLKNIINNLTDNLVIKAAVEDLLNQHQGGKHIRGALIKLGEEIALNNKPAISLPVQTAYELFQTAILIHDDIIDKSPVRRGKATIHSSESDLHFGNSRGICIGDYGLFLANKILANSGLPAEILIKVFKLFSHIELVTLEGEIMDITLPYKPIDIANDYESYVKTVGRIFEYKTAWYTLVGPIMLGAICGGAGDDELNLLKEITMPLGIAFQIKDDLLGIYASEKVLGKPALSDVQEKKQTLLYGYAYYNATKDEKFALDKSYGNESATDDDLQVVRDIFIKTGAKEYAENEIKNLSKKSLDLINEIKTSHKTLLKGLVHYLITRKY